MKKAYQMKERFCSAIGFETKAEKSRSAEERRIWYENIRRRQAEERQERMLRPAKIIMTATGCSLDTAQSAKRLVYRLTTCSNEVEKKESAKGLRELASFGTTDGGACTAAIREAGGIAPLVTLLASNDVELLKLAAGALRNLAINPTNKDAIREAGGIVPLVSLLRNKDIDVLKNVTGALRNLSINDTNKDAIREAGGIVPLVSLLRNKDIDVLKQVTVVLRYLSVNPTNKDAIREAEGIAPLVILLANNDVYLLQQAISTLFNLTLNHTNRDSICEAGGLAPLVKQLSNDNDSICKSSIGALNNLARNTVNRDRIREAGGIASLVRLLRRTPFHQLLSLTAPVILKNTVLSNTEVIVLSSYIINIWFKLCSVLRAVTFPKISS